MSKYAIRVNGLITGFVIRANAKSDQNPIDETSQEWMDFMAIDPIIEAKAAIEKAISEIVVTVDSLNFFGNDDWQNKMARAVVSSVSDIETTDWIMANGSSSTVTSAQLKQALRLAGESQRAIMLQGAV